MAHRREGVVRDADQALLRNLIRDPWNQIWSVHPQIIANFVKIMELSLKLNRKAVRLFMEREGLMEEDIWEIGGGRRNEVFIDKLRKRILFFGIAFEFGIVIGSWMLRGV